MTTFVFALHRVGAILAGYQASDWTYGKAFGADRRVLTGTC